MRTGEHKSTLALCTLDDQAMGRSPEVPQGCPDHCPVAGGETGDDSSLWQCGGSREQEGRSIQGHQAATQRARRGSLRRRMLPRCGGALHRDKAHGDRGRQHGRQLHDLPCTGREGAQGSDQLTPQLSAQPTGVWGGGIQGCLRPGTVSKAFLWKSLVSTCHHGHDEQPRLPRALSPRPLCSSWAKTPVQVKWALGPAPGGDLPSLHFSSLSKGDTNASWRVCGGESTNLPTRTQAHEG